MRTKMETNFGIRIQAGKRGVEVKEGGQGAVIF
jgi:hypothetical protein